MAFFVLMRKRTFLIFTLYTWGRVLYGLIFHPYKTVREIIRRPVLVPVAISPLLSLLLLFILGKIGYLLIDLYGLQRNFVAIFLGGSFFALVFWQAFIAYLLISMISAKKQEERAF